MRILITGGNGFIGARLSKWLFDRGHEVIIGSRKKLLPPSWLPGAVVLRTNWDMVDEIERICFGMDVVIHTAGMNSQTCAADPVSALAFNGLATARLLHAAIRQNVKRFIYFSTFHVYSASLKGDISEEHSLQNMNAYATSHRAGEDLIQLAHANRQIEGIVVRLSNAFGAPMQKDTNCWMLVVQDLCHQAVTSHNMRLSSSGKQYRDFITMQDVCRAVEHLLHVPADALDNGVFNLGSGQSYSVWEMACMIQQSCERVLGIQPRLTRNPLNNRDNINFFEYKVDKICQTGFNLDNYYVEELELLLNFCKIYYT